MSPYRWFPRPIVGDGLPSQVSMLRVSNLTRGTELGDAVELAGSGRARRKGLLGRDGLSPGQGLWILPCEAVHTFWMRFPIDLVYLDRKHQVRKVRSNVVAWRLSACLFAVSVLELPMGTVSLTQTRPGDRIQFSPAALPPAGA